MQKDYDFSGWVTKANVRCADEYMLIANSIIPKQPRTQRSQFKMETLMQCPSLLTGFSVRVPALTTA